MPTKRMVLKQSLKWRKRPRRRVVVSMLLLEAPDDGAEAEGRDHDGALDQEEGTAGRFIQRDKT